MNAIDTLLQSHPAHQKGGSESQALAQARLSALEQFSQVGFPTKKVEEWKYTSTKVLQETGFIVDTQQERTQPPPKALEWSDKASTRLVFVNGSLHRTWSRWPTDDSLTIKDLNDAESALLQTHDDPFSNLNLAFVQDAVQVVISPKAIIDAPIHLVFLGQASEAPICSHPRVLIQAGQGSQCSIIQTHIGSGEAPTWINAVVHSQVEANADVHHIILHQGCKNLHYVGNIHAEVARDAAYHSYTYWLGGQLSRNDLSVALNGPGAETDLFGLYLCGDNEHLDNHTVVEHRVPHCRSNELYKGVLNDQAKAIFNGRIVVFKDAQKTDSTQANRNLLLSEKATINTKPELEIYADDVSCAHGTTVGQMDKDALFFLRSRGIGVEQAKVILTHAFCMELLETIPDPSLRARVQECVDARLTELTRNRS